MSLVELQDIADNATNGIYGSSDADAEFVQTFNPARVQALLEALAAAARLANHYACRCMWSGSNDEPARRIWKCQRCDFNDKLLLAKDLTHRRRSATL